MNGQKSELSPNEMDALLSKKPSRTKAQESDVFVNEAYDLWEKNLYNSKLCLDTMYLFWQVNVKFLFGGSCKDCLHVLIFFI